MHITRISGLNIKGGNHDVTLDRANVIHGDNWSSKSTILDLVRLALVGYLPELGKRNSDTFGLASGPTMEVRAEFSNGASIRRTWSAKGDSVKAEAFITGDVGNTEILTVMLNADAYFTLTDSQRVQYVFENMEIPAMGRAPIIARVGEYDLTSAYAAIDSWDERTRKAPKPRNDQEELAALIEEVREDWKRCKENEDRQKKTVQGLIHLRANDEPSKNMAAMKDQRAELAVQIGLINEQKGGRIAEFTKMTGDRQRRAVLQREISHSDKSRLELVDAREALALLEAKLSQTPAVSMADVEAAMAKVGELNNRALACKTERGQIAAARDKVTSQASNLVGQTVCPYCGAEGEGWKALRAAEYVTELEKQDADYATIREKEKPLLVELEEAQTEFASLRSRRDARIAVESKLSSVQAQVARLEPQLSRVIALNEEMNRLAVDDPELTATVETLQTRLNILTQEARGLDRLIEEGMTREGDLVRMAQAEKERDEAIKLKDAAAAAGKELLAIQSEMVEAAFKPLLATANAIFGGVLATPLEYRAGEIGTRRDGTWVGHRTFSGAEKALTYAAIQAALAAKSPIRVMLLDELGRFTSANAEKVGDAILEALRNGHIDQFLGVDPERIAPYEVAELRDDTRDLSFRHHAIG